MRMEQGTREIRRTYNRLGLAMLVYMLIVQLGSVPVLYLVKTCLPDLYASSWAKILLQEAVQYLIALPAAFLIMKSAKTQRRPLQKRRLTASKFLQYFFISIGLLFLFNIVGTYLNYLVSLVKGAQAANIVEQSIASNSLGQVFFMVVISAPFGEELMFRKIIYDCVGTYGEKTYLFTSAAMFMLMHGNIVQYPYAFVLGLFFAWIYLRTGSLWSTVLLHAAVNFVGGVVSYLGMEQPIFLTMLSVLYLFSAGYTIWAVIRHRKAFHVTNDPPIGERGLDAALLNPGMVLFTVSSFVMAGCIILYL